MCCTVGELGSDCMMAGSSKDSTRGSSSCNMAGTDGDRGRGRESEMSAKESAQSVAPLTWRDHDGRRGSKIPVITEPQMELCTCGIDHYLIEILFWNVFVWENIPRGPLRSDTSPEHGSAWDFVTLPRHPSWYKKGMRSSGTPEDRE